MKKIIQSAKLSLLILPALAFASCATNRPSGSSGISLASETIRISGRVQLAEPAPAPKRWKLDDEMSAVAGQTEFTDEALLVSSDLGLANCVVSIHPVDTQVDVAPMEGALYEKVGPRYEPRVLAITPGTDILLRNRNSPCNGFMSRGYGANFNRLVFAGKEFNHVFDRAGAVPIACDLREYMRGAIVVVDTEWFAVTDSDGRWQIDDLPAGDYQLRVWHESMKRRKGKRVAKWTARPDEFVEFDYTLELTE